MWDSPNAADHRRLRRPSAAHLLAGALVLSLTLIAYLLWRPEVRALAFSPLTHKTQTVAPATPGLLTPDAAGKQAQLSGTRVVETSKPLSLATQPGGAKDAGAIATASAQPPGAAEMDTMMTQLQEMQRALAATASQLGLQPTAAGPSSLPATLIPPQPRTTGSVGAPLVVLPGAVVDTSALLAEIQRLYQVMQPLMVQMQTAVNSNRPAGELAAMRAQMNDIHQRLTALMAQVQAAKAVATQPNASDQAASQRASSVPPTQLSSDQAKLNQLQQMLIETQVLLQQLQNGSSPNVLPQPNAAGTAKSYQGRMPGIMDGLVGGMR